MRIRLPYSVKSHLELPLLDYEPTLSPYDMESVVLKGLALHPKITATGVHGSAWVEKAEGCESAVYINRDEHLCGALAGFSHEEHGLALVKTAKGYAVEFGDGVKLFGGEAVYSQVPGALIVALYDPPWTHVATSSYSGAQQLERAFKGRPVKAAVGYRSYSVVFSNGRTVLVTEDRIFEAGFPLEAVALVNSVLLARSSGWLVWMEPDIPRPTILLRDASAEFTGFHQSLPVFKVQNKLHRLEGGALVELNVSLPAKALVTASDFIVVDSGEALSVHDVSLKPAINAQKDSASRCWSTEGKVFCCTMGMCGVIEPVHSFIYLDSPSDSAKEQHAVRVAPEVPALVTYNTTRRVKLGSSLEIVNEEASVLEPCYFNVEIRHILGSIGASIESPASKVEVNAYAKAFTSTGVHECGGLSLLELDVKEVKAPSRVKVLVEGKEVRAGKNSICMGEVPASIEPVAVDSVAGTSKKLIPLKVEVVEIPEPALSVNVEHGGDYSFIRINTSAEKALSRLICRNGALELSALGSTVRNCITPARVEVELKHKGFIYRRREDVVVRGLMDYILAHTSAGFHEYREGGFIARYIVPSIPETNPLWGFKVAVGIANAVIKFKSKVLGRLVVYSGQGAKGCVVRPGLNDVSAPLSSAFYLVLDAGFNRYVYKLELPIQEQLKAAEAHALSLYNALNKWLK
ncbi:MAG: hypothetical protein QXK88_01385 [Desulfurococcaceae archaeon]